MARRFSRITALPATAWMDKTRVFRLSSIFGRRQSDFEGQLMSIFDHGIQPSRIPGSERT
jgi:hypothetical protein